MTIQLPGFNPNYIFRVLSDFWDGYKERDQLASLWGGMSQIVDDMYLQNYQADFGKSLETVPVYWRYSWSNLMFDNWIDNEVFHRHLWVEQETIDGVRAINLNDYFTPPESAGSVNFLRILLDGIVQQEGVDFTYSGGLVTFSEPLTGGRNMMIQWADTNKSIPYHFHKVFAETLTGDKSSWTDAVGDAFDPEGQGPYQFNDPLAPIEIWINGVRESNDRYVEPSSVLFQLNVAAPPTNGDWVVLRWIRSSDHPNPHVHYKYNYRVSPTIQQLLPLPFSADLGTAAVYINGVLQIPGTDYDFERANLLRTTVALEKNDLLEVEFYRKEYRWRHEIDTTIVSAPVIQDKIDTPNVVSIQGTSHSIKAGWLYSDYNFSDAWAPNLWVDENTIAKNFGNPIEFSRTESNTSYLYSTRGMWYIYWHGPAITNIEVGSKILLDLPIAPLDTTVFKVNQLGDGSYQIELAGGSLIFDVPAPLHPVVSAGDKVKAYQALSNGAIVWDYINNPEWWKYIPGFHTMWGSYSTSGTTWVGHFDDRGFIDDNGFFDDAGGDPDLEKNLFDKIKYFLWILLIDSSQMKTSEKSNDLIHFADIIKPAYTDYIALIEHTPKERIGLTDSVTLTLTQIEP